MSEQPASQPAASTWRVTSKGGIASAIASVAGITALIGLTAGLAVRGENIGTAISPVLLVSLLYVIWKAPLRMALLPLMFCVLTLEDPYVGFVFGQFKSPFAPIGALLLGNLNTFTGVEALHFSGLECITAYLLFIVLCRWATRSRIDRREQLETSNPMVIFACVAFLSIAVFWAYGIARGGSLSDSLWQVQRLAYLPIIFFLFQAALRGPPDYGSLAGVLIAAALIRSFAAILIQTYVRPPGGEMLHVATTHDDSLLFASAFAVLLAALSQRAERKRVLFCFAFLPVLIWGMVANNRRLVWVEVAAVIIAFYLISARTEIKHWVTRAGALALPFILLYGAIGWRSRNPVFVPIHSLRSVADSKADASAEWRDHEDYNLIYTLANRPFFGSGFGHEYAEYWNLPDISGMYRQYKYKPHNSVLGLLTSAGLVGFAGFWTLLVAGVFLAARSYHRAHRPEDRTAALSAIGIVLVYLIQAYGDVGFSAWNGVFILGPALAMVGKLAVLTGAWPAKRLAPLRRENA